MEPRAPLGADKRRLDTHAMCSAPDCTASTLAFYVYSAAPVLLLGACRDVWWMATCSLMHRGLTRACRTCGMTQVPEVGSVMQRICCCVLAWLRECHLAAIVALMAAVGLGCFVRPVQMCTDVAWQPQPQQQPQHHVCPCHSRS